MALFLSNRVLVILIPFDSRPTTVTRPIFYSFQDHAKTAQPMTSEISSDNLEHITTIHPDIRMQITQSLKDLRLSPFLVSTWNIPFAAIRWKKNKIKKKQRAKLLRFQAHLPTLEKWILINKNKKIKMYTIERVTPL